jgi:hypothetical protein
MKIYGTFLLALGLFSPNDAWGFQAAAPKMLKPSSASALQASSWDDMEKISPFIRIEGESRKTWQFGDIDREVVQVILKTEGRPVQAVTELWIGPNWTPVKLRCYSEDGLVRPIQTLLATRNRVANVELRNVGGYMMPLSGCVAYAEEPLSTVRKDVPEKSKGRYVEGGAVYTVALDATTEQVQVLLATGGKQLSARVELLTGPNNIKQYYEIFTNNGLLNSLFVVFDTPGAGSVVRVVNTNTVEFPCTAYVEPVLNLNEEAEKKGNMDGGYFAMDKNGQW